MGVEFLLGDGEAGDPHRQHALDAPDKEGEGRFRRNDLDGSGGQEGSIEDHAGAFGIKQHFQGGKLGVDAHAGGNGICLFQLIGGVNLDFQVDGFFRGAVQAHRFRAGASLL